MNPVPQKIESTQHVVLLGASNLTIGWQPLLEELQAAIREPIDLRVALGMGRSYLEWSGFWARRLPGILQSEIWSSLPPQIQRPPLALLTDIGNDIVYERSPDVILAGIQDCVQKIREWHPDVKIVMTGLPQESVSSIGPVHFRIARTILFPGCRLTLDTITSNTEKLNRMCEDFAQREGIAMVHPKRNWYGVDPIHVVPKFRHEAFRSFFAGWFPELPIHPASPQGDTIICGLPKARHRTLLGIHRHVRQPVFENSRLRVSAY